MEVSEDDNEDRVSEKAEEEEEMWSLKSHDYNFNSSYL
jgi:hypothetical protein